MKRLLFSESSSESSSDSDSDNELRKSAKKNPGPITFRCAPQTSAKLESADVLFVVDVNPDSPENQEDAQADADEAGENVKSSKSKKQKKKKALKKSRDVISLEPHIKELLAKSDVAVGFEKTPGEGPSYMTSRRELLRKRRAERERTKGNDWFDMPATEMTEERERDLEIVQMRDALDTKTHYKKGDRSVLPKYFQVGTIVENKADFYSSRIPKKQRKRTMVEELMADVEFQTKQRKKYQEIKAQEAMTRKGAFQRRTFPKKKTRVLRRH